MSINVSYRLIVSAVGNNQGEDDGAGIVAVMANHQQTDDDNDNPTLHPVARERQECCNCCCVLVGILVGIGAGLLGIISVLELVNLVAFALGVPDTALPYNIRYDDEYIPENSSVPSQSWESNNSGWIAANSIDLFISVFGFAVSILGFVSVCCRREVRLAKIYAVTVLISSIAWVIFNFITSYEEEFEFDNALTKSCALYNGATGMVLVTILWITICCAPAFFYQRLLLWKRETEATLHLQVAEELELAEVSSNLT